MPNVPQSAVAPASVRRAPHWAAAGPLAAALSARITTPVHTVKMASNNTKFAGRINTHSSEVHIFCDEYELPAPFLHERVAIRPQVGRLYVMQKLPGINSKSSRDFSMWCARPNGSLH